MTKPKIAAVIGHGRVWTRMALLLIAVCSAAGAVLFVTLGTIAVVRLSWEYSIGSAGAFALAGVGAFFFARGLMLSRRVDEWLTDSVRLRVKTTLTGNTVPVGVAVQDQNPSVPRLPADAYALLIRFRYGDVTVTKTAPCRGVYAKYADREIEIFYSPTHDKVMLVAIDD